MNRRLRFRHALRATLSGVVATLVTSTTALPSRDADGGVAYQEPASGWRYTLAGDPFPPGLVDNACIGGVCPPGFGTTSDEGALDGTWRHDQGDKWDGSAPGDPLGDYHMPPTDPDNDPISGNQGVSPGGAGVFSDGGVSYLRIQDAGNPEDTNTLATDTVYNGYVQGNLARPNDPDDPINTNRRVYFGHNMQQDGALTDELVLSSTGLTVSFRVRIPDSGPLDDIYALDEDGDGNLNVTPWFENAPNGHGGLMTNSRGMINFVQNNPGFSNEDTSVGFALTTSADVAAYCEVAGGALCTGTGSGGLIMNNLNGDVPTGAIDSSSPGTLNILEMSDESLNEWNEFWITLENNAGKPGNIEAKIYMNGSLTPQVFQLTLASNNNAVYAKEDDPFVEFGISDNDGFGSLDIDFLSYQIGIIAPVAAPVDDADFNNDGRVDAGDFLLWQRSVGTVSGASNAQGDANGDGAVNAADFALWESAFGSAPANATSTSVPEPCGASLMLTSSALAWTTRRRRA